MADLWEVGDVNLTKTNLTLMLGLVDTRTERSIPYTKEVERYIEIRGVQEEQNKTI